MSNMKYEDVWNRPFAAPTTVGSRDHEIYEFLKVFQEDVKFLKNAAVHIGRNIFWVNKNKLDSLKQIGSIKDSISVHPADGGRLRNDGFKYFRFNTDCPNVLGLPNFWYRWTANHFYVIWNQ